MNRSLSVCMATHNGETFLREQLDSILPQLGAGDELVVVDDASTDRTRDILRAYADPRIHLHLNPKNLGAEQSFDRAIRLATGDLVFMADQDDVWLPGRIDLMAKALESTGRMVVSSNSEYIDREGNPVSFRSQPVRAEDSTRYLKNILGVFLGTAPYYGCAMAFRREFATLVCPFPAYVESHDLWIALAANLIRSNVHIGEPTLRRRIHGANASVVRRSLARKAWSRMIFARSVIHILARYFRQARARPSTWKQV